VSENTVLLAAGGTAGHLFPAFALAQELARRGIAVELVTDLRGDKYGADFPARAVHQVPSATLVGRSPGAMAKTGMTLTRGVAAAFKLLGRVKPKAVIGFGGYPTFPPLMAARLRRIPSALHEQNAVLGRANAMLAKRVSAIATSFETVKGLEAALASKVRFTGNPVRDTVIDWSQRAYSKPDVTGPLSLLVFGGSQGARFFSEAMPPALERLPEALRRRLFVVQQCREEDLAKVEAAYTAAGIRAKLATFFANLPEEMARSHLVVGRAGASTVAELTVMGRPSILVPLPHAIDNDQLANALLLDEAGGALCLEQKTLTPEAMADALTRLLGNPDGLAAAAANAKAQGRPDAVLRLADLVEELMGLRTVATG
jgi:UDP-N-acetylglucosamine--N-acetylmuramyl-(pentapeptide) pyrophosphoryl-undecaprenol N-acetylglucosamine transferase